MKIKLKFFLFLYVYFCSSTGVFLCLYLCIPWWMTFYFKHRTRKHKNIKQQQIKRNKRKDNKEQNEILWFNIITFFFRRFECFGWMVYDLNYYCKENIIYIYIIYYFQICNWWSDDAGILRLNTWINKHHLYSFKYITTFLLIDFNLENWINFFINYVYWSLIEIPDK